MKAYEKLKEARRQDRPTASSYIDKIFTSKIELHGDRAFGDDPAMLGGIGFLGDIPVTYIATERGVATEERIRRNFGCPKPEGYRKAKRLMLQAEKFSRPVVTFVDTSGAFCGVEAEERGQGQAIADSIECMMGLKVPIISIIIGEGESGGALGIAAADSVYMLRNAVYSVISPEGCAGILMKDSSRAAESAEDLKLTSDSIKNLGAAERIIEENFDAFGDMCEGMRNLLIRDITKLSVLDTEQLCEKRFRRYADMGDSLRIIV